ncbi:peptide MFS transporter [Chitinimonas sp.]|uniref:peptide MFS transporter n=1 Tax=Chitinimonas sp. TaxID=1934313 RepID=UPI0035B10CFE
MSSLKQKLAGIPDGAASLFFIQMFSTLGYAVLYSSLVLYATKHMHLSDKDATALMGVFGAFNYGLHLFGGYLGGRFLSNRNLFVGGMAMQVLGCACMATGSEAMFYWGLAMFLTGSGLNVTCLNMMLTQRFAPDDTRRESAFLWNYAGMNVGFFMGFTGAGHFQQSLDYSSMFIFASLGNLVSIALAAFNWKTLTDRNTPLLDVSPNQFKQRFMVGLAIVVGLVPLIQTALHVPAITGHLVEIVSAIVLLALIYLTVRHPDARERNNMWAYLVLTVGSLVFWSLYQMAPSGLALFADRNVDLMVMGVLITPQWIQNINTVVVAVGGPLMAILFTRLRERGWKIDVPKQFSVSILLMGVGFLVLPLGISMAGPDGKSAFVWLFISYVLQSVGELLISPVGYAMIGRLAPRQYQGIMMGSWMMVTGLASVFAGRFSGMIPQPEGNSALATNPAYASLFGQLGWGSVIVGVVLVALIPFLTRLIKDKDDATTNSQEAPLAPVAH